MVAKLNEMSPEQRSVFEEIEYKYVAAYIEYKKEIITLGELSMVEMECMLLFLELYSSIHPYYDEIRNEAASIWKRTIEKFPYIQKREEVEPELMSLEVGSLGAIKTRYELEYIKFLSGNVKLPMWVRFLSGIINEIYSITGQIQPYFFEIEKAAEHSWKYSPERCKRILDRIEVKASNPQL